MTLRPAVPSGRALDGGDAQATFALDVQYYLSQEPRQLPSRYLYDALGSRLFEAICRLPWYPITRAEMRLLEAHSRDTFAATDPLARIVELGCGSGEKLLTLVGGRSSIRGTLDLHLVDVSVTALAESVRTLSTLEGVRITPHEASYEAGLTEVRERADPRGRTLVLFLGSNIGNFDPPGAHEFLREIRAAIRPGDFLLLGVDLVKPEPVLLLAYDDPLGVTAAFNRNLLVRINRELGGNFDLPAFAHRAVWNRRESRVEMHLVSLRRQAARVEAADLDLMLEEGEAIWTESSYKYEPNALIALAEHAGFTLASQWIDADDPFALTLFRAL
jgi:dimethylhistidine N-methyltransferase